MCLIFYLFYKILLTKYKQNVNIISVRKRHAGVAELADALDLGSSVTDVGVQVLSPAPRQSKLYIACSDFFIKKSEFAHFAALPLSQKVTLGLPVRL